MWIALFLSRSTDTMSLRPTHAAPTPQPERNFGFSLATDTAGQLTWKDLSETEKSAASLGVDPSAWKPIGFLNDSHYATLLQANALDSELAKKLEAYKAVSNGQA